MFFDDALTKTEQEKTRQYADKLQYIDSLLDLCMTLLDREVKSGNVKKRHGGDISNVQGELFPTSLERKTSKNGSVATINYTIFNGLTLNQLIAHMERLLDIKNRIASRKQDTDEEFNEFVGLLRKNMGIER